MEKKPNSFLEKTLVRLLKERDRESFRNDLEEIYLDIAEEKGSFCAHVWYFFQTLKSFPPAFKNKVLWQWILFKNHLRIAYRNSMHHKGITVINIIGLSVSMAAFLMILLYTRYESSFDTFHRNSENIYRIQYEYADIGEKKMSMARTVPAIGPALKDGFDEVTDFARITDIFLEYSALLYKDVSFLENKIYFATPSFLTLFTFPLIQGDPLTALSNPLQAVLTRSAAERYFGKENPLGKTIVYNKKHDFIVTGVCEDIPSNSHIQFDVLFSYKSFPQLTPYDGQMIESSWESKGFYTYVSLKPGTDPRMFQEKIDSWIKQERSGFWEKRNYTQAFLLQPIEDIHLYSNLMGEMLPDEMGNGQAVKVLTLIAFFILALAWLNYINISTSRALERAKEVGIRKVSGALRRELIRQFMVEYAGISLFSVVLSLFFVSLTLPFFIRLTESSLPLDLLFRSGDWFDLAAYFLAGTLFSGFYPAFVLSSFKPSSVIKGNLSRAPKGAKAKKYLVVFQLAVSVGLIAGTIIVAHQMFFIGHKDLGFDMKQTVVLWGPGTNSPPPPVFSDNFSAFRDDVKTHPQIFGFTTSTNIPGTEILFGNVFRKLEDPPDKAASMPFIGIDDDHIPAFGIRLLAGRNFSKDFASDSRALIINEEAVRFFRYTSSEEALNRKIVYRGREMTIIGVIDSYHQMSLKSLPRPIVYLLDENRGYISIKIQTENIRQTISDIRDKWKRYFPGIPFNYLFLDEFFNRQYKNDVRFSRVFSLFAVLTIYIACLGLFALASLNAVQRTKEIGIRKALGASGRDIYILLTKEFVKLVLVAGVIAVPFTLLKMSDWMANFAYGISIQWWHFALAWIFVLLVVVLTISFQTLVAARTDPVEAIRYE